MQNYVYQLSLNDGIYLSALCHTIQNYSSSVKIKFGNDIRCTTQTITSNRICLLNNETFIHKFLLSFSTSAQYDILLKRCFSAFWQILYSLQITDYYHPKPKNKLFCKHKRITRAVNRQRSSPKPVLAHHEYKV